MGELIYLDIHRNDKALGDLTDPCSICKDKSCKKTGKTCQRAMDWWDQLAAKFLEKQ